MGRITFLLIGLIVGFGFGVVGMQLGLDRYLAEQPTPAHPIQAAVAPNKYLLCHSELMKRDYPLIVRSDASGPKSVSFPGKTDSDEFQITEATDTRYTAVRLRPKYPEATKTIELDRVTGSMIETLRIPSSAVKVLADICNKRIPPTECRSRIESIDQDDWISCVSVANDMECPKWLAGSNVSSRFEYQCRTTERTF